MTIGIVGLGLIGGSLGLSLKAKVAKVIGRDADPDVERSALDLGCVDEVGSLDACDLVFLAVPPDAVVEAFSTVPERVPIVSDCASVKVPIVRAVQDPRFIGGHPMAGKESGGLASAEAQLFRGCAWILCPGPDATAVATLAEVVKLTDALPVLMTPEEHDRHVALLSHVPHVLASILHRMAADLPFADVAGGSWRDLTRVARSDPALWSQILRMNAAELASHLHRLASEIEAVAEAVETGQDVTERLWSQPR